MLRKRKNRRYNETEEGDGVRKFNIQDQIKSQRFETIKGKHLQELTGDTFTLKLIQRNGFDKPILISKPDGLDLRVPQKSFQVKDVRNYVGHERVIDVMDVRTQKNIEMSMKDWCKYYESKNRDKLLNVISLEFSHTELDNLVEAPLIVRLLDWVDLVWPKFLKQSQTESTNSIDKMKYPKVQKYCLMSVKGSYTDFHIDFGGTSVWYHILRGKKIFWMVPPTELNLLAFEEWTLSGMQQDVFFGDTVEECFRVELSAGNTFFIPSGWIHAVYTLEDSLVFGGNFLHSFGIEYQLKVSKIEDATRVPVKFRYPFYTEILWYVVQHYVHCLTGKDHLQRPDPSKLSIKDSSATQSSPEKIAPNKNNKSIESEDETTESEQDERDRKNIKRKPTSRKRVKQSNQRTTRSKKARKQSSNKKTGESEEDENEEEPEDDSTEIDSSNEDTKPTEKVTTCRMTKNSLLRLQYEVDEQQQQQTTQSKEQSKTKSNLSSTPSKQTQSTLKNPTASPNTKLSVTTDQPVGVKPNSNTTINLAEMILNHESSKLNGWGANAVTVDHQTTWSSSVEENEQKGPPRIYVTKYELIGLKSLVKHLGKLSGAKKHLPALIRNSRALLDDCRKMIADHENDDPELAITGKPITLELLNAKKSDINDLIGQFFKPKLESGPNNEFINTSPNNAQKSEPSNQQQKSKSNNQEIANTSLHAGVSSLSEMPPLSTPDKKETKCLSSNKKSFASNQATTTNLSTTPRPKSPPTRPISNNQYSSRTLKGSNPSSNNNLLLPGSFADLIAATSTEKKVFDVSGADIASSLFGGPTSPQKHMSAAKNDTVKPESARKSSSHMVSDLLDKPASVLPSIGSSSANTSSTDNSPSKEQATAASAAQTKSPEPPKSSPQKRFINPSFKPQNKEKLIFASAPYVSPVHEQPRSLYPWQAQAMNHMPTPSRAGPSISVGHQGTSGAASPNIAGPAPVNIIHNHQVATASYVPDANITSNQARVDSTSTEDLSNRSLSQTGPVGDTKQDAKLGDISQQSNSKDVGDNHKINSEITTQKDTIQLPQPNTTSIGRSQILDQPSKASTSSSRNLPESPLVQKNETPGKAKPSEVSETTSEQKVKKPAKPRGPPKKSKEARQVLSQSEAPTLPVSVIKIAPSTSGTSFQPYPIQQHLPQMFQTAQQPLPVVVAKPAKPKRSKKQKTNDMPTVDPIAQQQQQQQQQQAFFANQTMLSQAMAGQQSLFGFVAPPVSSGASTPVSTGQGLATVKVSQPSYLLSRPFLFNTMPTISTAQLPPGMMTRPPMRMISASIPSTMGLPTMQQGARIVWATQPQQFAPTMTTTNAKSAQAHKPNQQSSTAKLPNAKASASSASTSTFSPATTSQISSNTTAATAMAPRALPKGAPDNTALLSLATTALSTAPMITNPSLGTFTNRVAAPQAIMVSSANSHPALFAGQHLFSPLMQRLPMAPIVTTTRPGAPRPTTGQLVFARLPNQTIFNQPRFLITQQGFMQQRMQTPNLVPGQPTQTLAFAPYKPSTTTQPKTVKTKKVRTN